MTSHVISHLPYLVAVVGVADSSAVDNCIAAEGESVDILQTHGRKISKCRKLQDESSNRRSQLMSIELVSYWETSQHPCTLRSSFAHQFAYHCRTEVVEVPQSCYKAVEETVLDMG